MFNDKIKKMLGSNKSTNVMGKFGLKPLKLNTDSFSKNATTSYNVLYAVHIVDYLNQPGVSEVNRTQNPKQYVKDNLLPRGLNGRWKKEDRVYDAGEEVVGFAMTKESAENVAKNVWNSTLKDR